MLLLSIIFIMKLSVVIPMYNEEKNALVLYERLKKVFKKDFKNFKYEIITIDDGSTDETFSILKKIRKRDANFKIIRLSRNFGHHYAITAGLDYARGNYIVMMDGDLQDQPEEIIKLYRKLKEGYDLVYAVDDGKNVKRSKKILSKIFELSLNQVFSEKIEIQGRIFRILTQDVNESMKHMREQNRYLPGIMSWTGFRQASQKVSRAKRSQGETKYSYTKQLSLASDAIFSFSRFPLKLIFKLSFILFLFAFLIFLLIIYSLIIGRLVQFIEILAFSIFFTSAIQTLAIGIIGEYMGRSYIEIKRRPIYVIKEALI